MADPKRYTTGFVPWMAQLLASANDSPIEMAAQKSKAPMTGFTRDANNVVTGINYAPEATAQQITDTQKLIDQYTQTQDLSQGATLGQLGSLAGGAFSSHPFLGSAAIGTTAMNLGGLMDGNGIGGQLGGAGLGALGSYLLSQSGVGNPYAYYMLTTGGGALGSLFDKLRAKKETEQQQVSQYYGGGR